ncbi:LMBR1 domain-containing protein 2 homolog A-like isoform X1 [Fagus crenata]
MACSNTFGLVTGAFLLGFGLSEIPKGIWKNADWTAHQKLLTHKVAKMAVKLDDAHQEFSNSIVIAQATSKQMSKRDPLRPYMNIIDDMLFQMLKEDTSFKPQGGRLGENDMDYDTDEKSMATLRRQLRRAREEYYRYRSEYTNFVLEALELEDTMKNNEHCNVTGWRYISSFRPERSGTLGSLLDMIELMWRCILRKQLQKLLAIILGCMSAAILLAEATILPSGVDLSLFSILINAVGRQEVLVQVAAFIPLMYMCMCTYYSLFKIGMLMFYSLTPRQTSSVSLLMICSMVARYAPPISYNFLNLIRLDGDEKTIFEQIMGNIDDAVPFFGKGFNKIYPLIMVIYTLLIASNFFDRVIEYFGNWKIFKFQNESDDMDGFDQSGVIILKKERSGLEQGHTVGEHVIPLARNFNNVSIDVESWSSSTEKFATELKSTKVMEDGKRGQLQPLKEEALVDTSREAINKKHASLGEHNKQASNMDSVEKNVTSSTADSSNLQNVTAVSSSRIASKWEAVKNGFQNFKSNIDAKRFIHLRQIQETKLVSNVSSSESLDEIFQRLKQPTINHRDYSDDDDDDYLHDHGLDIRKMRPSR